MLAERERLASGGVPMTIIGRETKAEMEMVATTQPPERSPRNLAGLHKLPPGHMALGVPARAG